MTGFGCARFRLAARRATVWRMCIGSLSNLVGLLVLECELVSMNEENCTVVGRIVNCAVEEAALTDGKPDAAKMRPICFAPCQHVYRLMGETVAKVFSCGKVLKG